MAILIQKEPITLEKTSILKDSEINLPASKSLSNRALIINALASGDAEINNLSEARDTRTMARLLGESGPTWDVLDAGTTMRFLTAYSTVSGLDKVLTGTPRMQERPIGLLVDALRSVGGRIEYLNQAGYPPIRTMGFGQTAEMVEIQGNVSSQYISAMLMVAPCLPKGLRVRLVGKVGSKPYIMMTLALMGHFGAKAQWAGDTIHVPPQPYRPAAYTVEPDWSAASYWYSLCALASQANIKLLGLAPEALQGDSKIAEIMGPLGVATTFVADGAVLSKTNHQTSAEFDFAHCPDLAMTVAVVCAAKGIACKMTGLESLKIKETDRVLALQEQLAKIGARLDEHDGYWALVPAASMPGGHTLRVETYDDHRMAMAFAPLATMARVVVENPGVVDKSYPRYWENLMQAGFQIS